MSATRESVMNTPKSYGPTRTMETIIGARLLLRAKVGGHPVILCGKCDDLIFDPAEDGSDTGAFDLVVLTRAVTEHEVDYHPVPRS